MADPTNVGAPNTNPSSPASPGGSEGTGNPPSAAQPSGADAASTTSASSEPASSSDAIDVFTAGVTPLIAALTAALPVIDPAVAKHHATVGQKQLQVIAMASAMMRANPKLSGTTADELDAGTNDVETCNTLSALLRGVADKVDGAGRLSQENNWHVASGAVATAQGGAAERGHCQGRRCHRRRGGEGLPRRAGRACGGRGARQGHPGRRPVGQGERRGRRCRRTSEHAPAWDG